MEIKFSKREEINHTIMMEDYREGHRIREYIIEGLMGTGWEMLANGSSVGKKEN